MANADEPKPGPQISSIRAIVRIQTPPELNPTTGEIEPGRFIGFDTAARDLDINRALRSVTTSKNLAEPCGRATLTFSPERIQGYTWADLIPSYSLIEIFLQRYPENPQPILVFLGLTDAREVAETYMRDGSVQREVKVSARELSCLFVDWRTLYLPAPPESILRGTATQLPSLFSEQVQLLGMLALDPEFALTGESPVTVIGKFVQMVTTGLKTKYNRSGMPLIDLQLPYDRQLGRPRKLADYLIFDEARARRELFDPTARLPASSQFTLTDHSLWNLVDTFSDPVYQELFTQTVDGGTLSSQDTRIASQDPPSFGNSFVEVVFRKKPFGARLGANGKFDLTSVRDSRGSQFDREFEADPLSTFEITDRDVTHMALRRSPEDLFNLYYVFPQSPSVDLEDFQALFPPLVDDADGSPSSIARYGLRMLRHADYYFGEADPDTTVRDTQVDIGIDRAKMLYFWYRYNPLFHRGSYDIRGNALARVGMRMVHHGRDFGPDGSKGKREYYVTSVNHSMQFDGDVIFRTSVGVERGWPI